MLFIDLTAIRSNIRALRSAAPSAKFLAVVKDNAYGHGLVPVAESAVEAGADWLGVVRVWEGVQLREAGIELPILVLGYVPPEDVAAAVRYRIDVPLMDLGHAHALREAIPEGKRLRVHLKVETGLNRFGVRDRSLLELARFAGVLRSAGTSSPFVPVGVYSHFAAVEESELEYSQRQIEAFTESTSRLGAGANGTLLRHLAATGATLVLPASHFDMVRCGIGIYGLWPSEGVQQQVGTSVALQPALQWVEPIRALKAVNAGDAVGYGCAWRPNRPSTVALLDVGYADGLPRHLGETGITTIFEQPCPIVGRICSNVTFIDVTDIGQAAVGDEVTLLSNDPTSPAFIDAQADRAGTINYELVMRLPAHLQRQYVQ